MWRNRRQALRWCFEYFFLIIRSLSADKPVLDQKPLTYGLAVEMIRPFHPLKFLRFLPAPPQIQTSGSLLINKLTRLAA
jgi:hypothetical protein